MDHAKAAEEKKVKGNEEHKKGNYPQAIRFYTDAISKHYYFKPLQA